LCGKWKVVRHHISIGDSSIHNSWTIMPLEDNSCFTNGKSVFHIKLPTTRSRKHSWYKDNFLSNQSQTLHTLDGCFQMLCVQRIQTHSLKKKTWYFLQFKAVFP
jgi:hypothetical protein